jgi:hypothetical protein
MIQISIRSTLITLPFIQLFYYPCFLKVQIPSLENPCQPLIEDDQWHSTEEMATEPNEKFPRWPALFEERRNFSREAENQSYIKFLQTRPFKGEEDEEEEEEEDDVSSEDDNDVSSEHADNVGGEGNDKEYKDENQNNDENAETYNRQSIVRLFMTGMTGDEYTLHYRDQVEEVASICEQASLKDSKHVALLDERNILRTIFMNKGLPPPGDCRPYLGPLTAQRLGEELSRKVVQILYWNRAL